MRLKLGEILVRAGVIDETQLLAALGEQRSWGHRLGVTLVKMGFVTEAELVNALANQLNLPIAHLDGKRIQPEVLALVPAEFADKNMCLPLFLKQEGAIETLFVGMDDPCNLSVLDDLAFQTGKKVRPVLVASSELCQGIDYFYRGEEAMVPPAEPAPASREISIRQQAARHQEPESGQAATAAEGAASAELEAALEPAQVPEPDSLPALELDDPAPAPLAAPAEAPPVTPAPATAPPASPPMDEAALPAPPVREISDERRGADAVESASAAGTYEVETRKILHTLAQLLIAKGVIDRDELANALAEVIARDHTQR